MKRITAIEINNFKAYKALERFELQQGQNMLIYGENGSGKSSLFKAFDYFFMSSIRNNIPFQKNLRHQEQDGVIRLTFSDFDNKTYQLQVNSNITFTSSSVDADTNNGELFIKDAALTKGFLDYTDLLKIYAYRRKELDFFDFFVLELLGNYIALKAGGNKPLRKSWKDIENEIFNCYSRNSRKHKEGISKLPQFEVELRSMLDEVFHYINEFFDKYFSSMNMHIDYQLDPVTFTYGNPDRGKSSWHIDKNLALKIVKNGIRIDDYKQALNEASLSALSVCMYLAALKSYPLQQDMKCLFLDDVFIGLDTGNRLPILNILMNEFKSYQVFIATYDRSWYLLAKSAIEAKGHLNWKKYLIFEGKDNEGMVPIILEGKDNIELAEEYLYDNKPDYPASVNYFRKALEEIIPKWMPKNSLTDENCVAIASYRLTRIIDEALSLLSRLQELFVSPDLAIKALQELKAELHPIIHPLSHFVVDTPVYKQELINICNNVKLLKHELENMNLCENARVILGHHDKLKAVFKGTSGWEFHYEFIMDEPVYMYRGLLVDWKFSFGRCHTARLEGWEANRTHLKPFSTKGCKNETSFIYDNLDDGISKILTFLNSQGKTDVVVYPDKISYFEHQENNGSFKQLEKILNDVKPMIK